jgi:hypothetical protein
MYSLVDSRDIYPSFCVLYIGLSTDCDAYTCILPCQSGSELPLLNKVARYSLPTIAPLIDAVKERNDSYPSNDVEIRDAVKLRKVYISCKDIVY